MRFPEYESHDGVGLARLVADGEIAAAELVAAAAERIAAREPQLGALTQRLESLAADAAQRVRPGSSPLAGVPTLLKDLGVQLEGLPTGNGTRHLLDVPAPGTSTVAQRLIDAGLPILGKSNTAQFGLSYSTEPQDLHATANPWDQRLSAGGSSGGAGAAVAAGYVPLAHASDGGGSIRVPASVNGLVGLKPSRGRVPMGPVIGEAWSGLATNLVVSRSVRDTAAALDVMAGPEPGDPYAGPPAPDSWLAAAAAPPGRLRIALMTEASATWPSDPLCVQAARDAATLLTELGHTVDAAAPELDRDAFARAFLDTIAGHALDDLSLLAERVLGRAFEPEDVEPMTAAIAEHGRRVGVLGHIRGRTELQIAGRALGRFHRDWDLILTPTLAVPPWPLGAIDHAETDIDRIMAQLAGRSPFTQLANANGAPAISLPLFWTDAGLPIGVMLQAPLGGEATLLQVAAQCEAARPWAHRRPEISGS